MSLKNTLLQTLNCEITDDEQTLKSKSTDASVFEVKPKIVAYPKNVDEIKSIVKFVLDNPDQKLSITVRSGGTDMSGGAIGESIILDTSRYFNKLISLNSQGAILEPGIFYRNFEAESLKQNLLLPTYPASREICTIGGMIANNSGGELELTYGPINNYIKALKVVLSDGNEYKIYPLSKNQLLEKMGQADFEGEIYSKIYSLIENNRKLIADAKPNVSKNSTGYELWNVWRADKFDLSKLFIGSQGTLGIITQAELSLIRPKKEHVLLVINLENHKFLDKIINAVLHFSPESFECYDDQTIKMALSHPWDLSSNFKYQNRISAYLELKSDQRKPIPNLVLLANFTSDNKADALEKAENAKNAVSQFNVFSEIKNNLKDAEKYWLIRHKSFGLLMKYSKAGKASPFIDDIIVKPEYLPEFLPKLDAIIAPYKDKMVYTLAGHIGDGNFHIIPLMDLSKPQVRAIIPELMEKVFKLVFEYKGSMSGEHNDGLIRGAYLPEMYGTPVYELFKKVKEIFDPKNIFNPHKKTDASFKYSFEHVIKN
jgi:FAD/FMN-containing dehydrogenase